jgi:hypothetical protein
MEHIGEDPINGNGLVQEQNKLGHIHEIIICDEKKEE